MSAWTEDRIDRLKTLWLEGQTAETISRKLGSGISRSAVLGKVHRMGLSAGRSPTRAPADPSRQGQEPAQPGNASHTTLIPRMAKPVVQVDLDPGTAEPCRGRRSILTVQRLECRWPIGDPLKDGFRLCGCRARRGAYCADHAAVAYRGPPQSLDGLIRWAGVA